MMDSSPDKSADNPLGLSLDFVYGRGYLWAQRQRVSDWIAMESLRMEIPDLSFPFDARGGLDRFQHTRCLVREVEFGISEVGLGDLLEEAMEELDGYEHLSVRFLEDAIHLSVKLTRLGADAYVSCRAALISPEPARADEVHLSLYDYRAYGPLPMPARVVMQQCLTGLLNTDRLRLSGRGESFTPAIAGDVVRFRPMKLLFLELFPRVGWKLPDLSGIHLERAQIRPGVIAIRASDGDHQSQEKLVESREGARALAAYEAKELFSHADKALFEGEMRQALSLLAGYRDVYGLHPALIARQLDALVADGSPGSLAEAESLRRELLAEDEEDLRAALVGPRLAMARRRSREEIIEAFEDLAARLRERGDGRDWALCQLSVARRMADDNPRLAADKLRAVLKRQPRHREALEASEALYRRLGDEEGLEEMLKRLTGVYQDRDRLKETYLHLARHLMDRQGDLGEARMYLEKVLRLDSEDLRGLRALGESYLLGGEPLRALKAFGSAARIAEGRGEPGLASRLHQRAAGLWFDEMEDPRQGLLGMQRALTLSKEAQEEGRDEQVDWALRADQYRQGAQMAQALGRDEEAMEYWQEAIQIWERRRDRGERWALRSQGADAGMEEAEIEEALVEAHLALSHLYRGRQREAAAASQMRRVLDLRPTHEEALGWLEEHLQNTGRPEELIALYEDLLEGSHSEARRLQWLEKLGDLRGAIGQVEVARQRYEAVLEVVPRRVKVREKLVELLRAHGRHESLARSLEALRPGFDGAGRQERLALELRIGEAYEAAGRWRKAARALGRALNCEASHRPALASMARVLEALVDEAGPTAAAPVGSKPLGQLLESIWLRLAEVEPEASRSREWLLRAAMSAEERGDRAMAAEVREQADALGSQEASQDSELDVDARLDAMLDALQPRRSSPDPAETLRQMSATPSDDGDQPEPSEPREPSEEAEEKELDSFRRRFADMIKKPSRLADRRGAGKLADEITQPRAELSEDTEPDEERAVTLKSILEGARRRQQELAGDAADEEGDHSAPDTKEQMETRRFKRPDISTANKNIETGGASGIERSLETARQRVEEARREGPEAQAEAMEDLIRLSRISGPSAMGDGERARVARELGELLYYDLEADQRARPYLEMARRLDPQGAGQETAVVNALEQIYKDSGDVDARLALLKGRLEAAQTVEMKTTYRLLLAQLVWDQRDDADEARRWLDEVLEAEPNHEAAHRLLAEIAKYEEDWEGAAQHLQAVADASSGGLDAVETTRELAEVYHQRLGDPARAQAYYEKVLGESPGDARALNGVKACVAELERWPAYIKALQRELGLLMGRPDEPVDLDHWDGQEAPQAIKVSASQIVAEAAQVMETSMDAPEKAHRLWGVAADLWPENGEALERRIDLDRRLEKTAALVDDLEAYAEAVLDDGTRFESLLEAAQQSEEEGRKARLARRALEVGEGLDVDEDRLRPLRDLVRAQDDEEQR